MGKWGNFRLKRSSLTWKLGRQSVADRWLKLTACGLLSNQPPFLQSYLNTHTITAPLCVSLDQLECFWLQVTDKTPTVLNNKVIYYVTFRGRVCPGDGLSHYQWPELLPPLFSPILRAASPSGCFPLYLQAVCCNSACDNKRNKEKPCLMVLSWEGGHFPQSTTLLERLLLMFPWQELGDTWDWIKIKMVWLKWMLATIAPS